MDRSAIAKAKSLGAERQENRGRDFSAFSPIYEARVMGYCVDVATRIDTLERECRNARNGQYHPIEVFALNTKTGHKQRVAVWDWRSAA